MLQQNSFDHYLDSVKKFRDCRLYSRGSVETDCNCEKLEKVYRNLVTQSLFLSPGDSEGVLRGDGAVPGHEGRNSGEALSSGNKRNF
jgi:hypothetical protein